MTNASCMLRSYDSFFNSLAKFAIQIGVGSTLEAEAETSSVHRVPSILALPKPFPRISPKHITSHYSIHHLAKLACASRRSAFHGGHQPLLVEIPGNYQRLGHSESRHTSQCILQLVVQVRHTDRCCIMAGSLAQRVLHSGGHHGLLDFRRGILLPQSPSWVCAFFWPAAGGKAGTQCLC